jgi:hypothetical protein
MRTAILRPSSLLPLLALAAGCSSNPEPGSGVDYATQDVVQGQPLVSCWTTDNANDSEQYELICARTEVGPLVVTQATVTADIGSTSTSAILDADTESATLIGTNALAEISVDITVVVDASGVAGLSTFEQHGKIVVDRDSHSELAPAVLEAPLDTWHVEVIGEEVALVEAQLDAYSVTLPEGEVSVAPLLPDVDLGGHASLWLAAPAQGTLSGTARFLADGLDDVRPITLDGGGSYRARRDGLEHLAVVLSDLPEAIGCSIDVATSQLQCAIQNDLPIRPLDTQLDLVLADGTPRSFQLMFVTSTEFLVFDLDAGTYATLDPSQGPMPILDVEPSQLPATVQATTSIALWEGGQSSFESVLGFGDEESFTKNKLVAAGTLSADGSSRLSVSLPFDLWPITLESDSHAALKPTVDGYSLVVGLPWGGHAAGERIEIGGPLAYVAEGIGATILLPVTGGVHAPITGTVGDQAAPFAITGPGRYVVSAEGVTLAQP